ncbi:MAG: hypothetical protein ABI411_03235 [Tahibacter sp.]
MSALDSPRPSRVSTAVPRMVAIGIVLLYCPLLALLATTVSFSEADSARTFIAEVGSRPPQPVMPLPVLRIAQWPAPAVQRDPMQALPSIKNTLSTRATDHSGDARATPAFQFVANYSDTHQRWVLGRSNDGTLASFRAGDGVNGGVIERIDPDRVMLRSGVTLQPVEIPRVEHAGSNE